MPQSLSLVIVHVIFSTKERRPFLSKGTRDSAHAYLAGVARKAGCECYHVGGVEDHVHLAIRLSRTLTIAQLLEKLKTSSSKWLKAEPQGQKDFSWQRAQSHRTHLAIRVRENRPWDPNRPVSSGIAPRLVCCPVRGLTSSADVFALQRLPRVRDRSIPA